MGKYNFEDDFEMLYLRHDYLNKIDKHDEQDVIKFKPIVNRTAKLMYDKYKFNFDKVGFDLEDVQVVTSIYMLAYMGLYSLKNNEEVRTKYEKRYAKKDVEFTEQERNRIERNNLINFLRQRLHHCSTLCSRKGRNIRAGVDIRRAFAETNTSKKASQEVILEQYKELGYRKVTLKELKEAKKNAKKAGIKDLFDKDGYRIIEIEILDPGIQKDDYQAIFDSYDGEFYRTPNQRMEFDEDKLEILQFKKKFESMENSDQVKILKNFIRFNYRNPMYKEEVKEARIQLKKIR